MRKRSKEVLLRLSVDEYKMLEDKITKSGLSKQKYLLIAALEKQINTGKEMSELKELNLKMAAQVNGINSLLSDLGEMTLTGEVYGYTPEKGEIERLIVEIKSYRKEGEILWQSLRSLIAAQNQLLD